MPRVENLTPKSYIKNHIYEKITIKTGKNKKISEENFKILEYSEYQSLLQNNYNVSQLKKIARKYSQKVSGNKIELLNRIYNYLKFSYYSIKIQKIWKGKLERNYNNLIGPAFKNRKCINETDVLSLNEIKGIDPYNFFSFKDLDGFIYGFEAKSFYNLIKKNNYKNPYNRSSISKDVIDKFNKYIKYSKLLKKPIDLKIINEIKNLTIEQRIFLKAQKIFQKIDEFGHITNVNWFLDLDRPQLIKLLREFIDIWDYRASLTLHTLTC